MGPDRRKTGSATSRCLIALSVLAAACGSPAGGPSPSPTPSPTPGPVSGAYTLAIQPAARCGLPGGTLSFPMDAALAPGGPHPGAQVLLVGDRSGVEAELLDDVTSVRGGVGTRADGALANEGLRVWIHAIAEGPVTRAADGRGEVVSGKLVGYVALGQADDDEGSLGTCSTTDHSFSLRTR
jgi:hypothetical protein